MASKKFSEFASAATWGAGWNVVGYNPAEGASVDANKRVPYSAFTDTFALKATFDAHAADQTLHLSAAQNAGLDASSSPSAVNPYLTESAGDARYPDATAQAAKDSGQDAAIVQNETDLTTHKSSGDHDARYLQDAPSDGTPYVRQDADWAELISSPVGGVSMSYVFNTSTVMADPNPGKLRCNNIDQTLATQVAVSKWSDNANDLSVVFDNMSVGSYFSVWEAASNHEGIYYQVTDAPVKNADEWYLIGVSAVPSSAGGIEGARDILVSTIANPEDRLPAGGTTGQHLAKATDASYDTAWVDAASGGGGLTHQVVTITSSNLNAANGNLYLADVSGLGAGIEFILPTAVAGGSIGLILTTDAPATYGNELVIRANGSIATYLLAKGEEMNFTSDGASWLFNTTGLLGVKAEISLISSGAPQFSPNAWTKVPYDTVAEDSYGYSDIANSKFVPRRSSVLSVYARAGTLQSPVDSSTTIAMTDGVTPSIIEAGKQYNDGAANRNLSPYGTVPYIGERGEDLFLNLYNASAGSLDYVKGSNIKLIIQEIW